MRRYKKIQMTMDIRAQNCNHYQKILICDRFPILSRRTKLYPCAQCCWKTSITKVVPDLLVILQMADQSPVSLFLQGENLEKNALKHQLVALFELESVCAFISFVQNIDTDELKLPQRVRMFEPLVSDPRDSKQRKDKDGLTRQALGRKRKVDTTGGSIP